MPSVTAADEPRLFVLDQPRDRPAGADAPLPQARRVRRGRAPRRPGPVLLAVDGNGLAHRAFHAVGGAEAPPGEALERVLLMLARIGAAVRPTGGVVGFDDPVRSLRRDRHPGYKATRPAKDVALVALPARPPGLLGLLGLSVVVPDGLEAD